MADPAGVREAGPALGPRGERGDSCETRGAVLPAPQPPPHGLVWVEGAAPFRMVCGASRSRTGDWTPAACDWPDIGLVAQEPSTGVTVGPPAKKLRHRETSSCPREWGLGGSRTLLLPPAVTEKHCVPSSLCRSGAGPGPPAVVLGQTLASLPPLPLWTSGGSHMPPVSPEGLSQDSSGRPCLHWHLAQHPRGEAGRAMSWAVLLQRVPAAQYRPGGQVSARGGPETTVRVLAGLLLLWTHLRGPGLGPFLLSQERVASGTGHPHCFAGPAPGWFPGVGWASSQSRGV